MKYNETLEQLFKKFFARAKVNKLDLGWKRNGDPLPTNYQVGVCVCVCVALINYLTCQIVTFLRQFTRKMSTPILHGGSKFRQGVLQLMIHSIDPLYEEPVSLAMKNGQEFIKDHVHPPGAPYCPFCGEDKHGVKINSNGVFHTGKPPPSLPAKMDNNFLPDDSGRFNGNNATKQRNLSRQSSILSQVRSCPVCVCVCTLHCLLGPFVKLTYLATKSTIHASIGITLSGLRLTLLSVCLDARNS